MKQKLSQNGTQPFDIDVPRIQNGEFHACISLGIGVLNSNNFMYFGGPSCCGGKQKAQRRIDPDG